MFRFKSPQTESRQSDAKNRIEELRDVVDTPKIVGSEQDLIPFGWRNSMQTANVKKMSRVLKTLAQAEQSRQLMPLNNDDGKKS